MFHSTQPRIESASLQFASLHTPQSPMGLAAAPAAPMTVSAGDDAVLVESSASPATSQQVALTTTTPANATATSNMDTLVLGLAFVGAWLLLIGVAMLARRFRSLRATSTSANPLGNV